MSEVLYETDHDAKGSANSVEMIEFCRPYHSNEMSSNTAAKGTAVEAYQDQYKISQSMVRVRYEIPKREYA